MSTPLSSFWRYGEAASYLGISPQHLRRKVMLHEVPHLKPFGRHGRVLFDPDDLAESVRASRVEVSHG